MFVLAAVTALALLFITAPYGRHVRSGWGPTLGNRVGWVLMESPSVVVFALVFFTGPHRADRPLRPLRRLAAALRPPSVRLPVLAAARRQAAAGLHRRLGVRIQSAQLGRERRMDRAAGTYAPSWLGDPRFLAGVVVFGTVIRHQPARRSHPARPPTPARRGTRSRAAASTSGSRAPLPRRDHRVDRLGHRDVVLLRARVRRLHRRQPGSARGVAPQVVPGRVPGLPAQAQGLDPARPLTAQPRRSAARTRSASVGMVR